MVQYTQAQKLAYYKRKAASSNSMTGYGAYKKPTRQAPKKSVSRAPPRAVARAPLRGYGAYRKDGSKKEKSIGAKIGGTIGKGLGAGAEQLIRWMTGLGDYEVQSNALLVQDPPPMVNDSNKGGTLIRHREYLSDVITSDVAGQFKLQSYRINPGLENCFPWLAQVASNYEQYSFEGLIFEFRSMSGDAITGTNTALGSVVMATNYNTLEPNFDSKSAMENHEFGASCKPSCDMMHPIECAPKLTPVTELYVRTDANIIPTDGDPRLYDWGNFQIATVGAQGTSVNLGELWCSYQVRLIKPRLYNSLGNYNDIARLISSDFTDSNVLGLTYSTTINTLGVTIEGAANTLRIPMSGAPQTYIIELFWLGSSVTGGWVPPVYTLSANLIPGVSPYGPLDQAPRTGVQSSAQIQVFTVQTVPGATNLSTCSIVWNAGTSMPNTIRNVVVCVIQVPNKCFNL